MKIRAKQGFTLVEIMIVVLIIGLLAAIAIPSFVRSRDNARKSACINNLRQIDSAKEQLLMAEGDGAPINWDSLGAYIRNVNAANPLTCPQSGAADDYALGDATSLPTCTVNPENHRLSGAADGGGDDGGGDDGGGDDGGGDDGGGDGG